MPVLAARNGVPADYAGVIARISNFEPESDGHEIRFMTGEAAGVSGIAQAWEQHAEFMLATVGADPAAVQGVLEYAQAMTEAAALMTRANARFQQVYQGVRETVSAGTVLPFNGRWVTGESA
jgi:hypothetical protein